MWRKFGLSTERTGVYYHYQFIYLYKLTNTKNRLRVENPGLDIELPTVVEAQASTTQVFFCLQKESGRAGTGARKKAGCLPTIGGGQEIAGCRSLIRMQTDKLSRCSAAFSSTDVCKTASSVEKRLHIHSNKCAEAAFLLSRLLLSKIGSAWIQCFSSASRNT